MTFLPKAIHRIEDISTLFLVSSLHVLFRTDSLEV
jgi:hypothetical protein